MRNLRRRSWLESLECRRLLDSTVVFNEVMYNPVADESHEWIELHNQLSVAVDLSDWSLSDAVEYQFPVGTYVDGGGYLVVASDPAWVADRYGLSNVLGPFDGRLSNGGERIELRNHTERLMNVLSYDDGGILDDQWPVGADGTGGSLAKRVAQSATDVAANWTTSRQLGGTPGQANFNEVGALNRQTLVTIDQDWRFDDSGADLGTAWRDPTFDDASWPVGPAILHQERDELPAPKQTELQLGIATYYFRTTFDYADDPSDAVLRLNHLVDDGAVFYLNGTEVERYRMDEGPVQFDTLAGSTTPNATLQVSRALDTSVLRQGTNTLAVEVHQSSLRSNDVVFGTELWLDTRFPIPSSPADVVRINEVAGAASSTTAWVEIRNSGAKPVDLDGWQLADTDDGQYTFPPTTLAPNQYIVLNREQLGFGSRAGQRLFLTTPDGQIADAVRVDAQPQGRSSAWDDRWQIAVTSTPGQDNLLESNRDVVINEIMYHDRPTYAQPGVDFAESDEEWIEIYNRGTSAVDLAGWHLNDAVRFTFPGESVLESGEYAVIAWDASAMQDLHPQARVLGQFEGRLSNSNERIQLLDTHRNLVDEVHYYEGGYWPEYADGDGASVELIDPDADNSHASAWAPSRTLDRHSWQNVRYQTTLAEIVHGAPIFFNELVLGLLDAGEVWLDNVSVREVSSAEPTELIQNGSFELNTDGQAPDKWRVLGTHQETTVISDPDDPANHVLRLVATGRMNYLSNHLETTFAGNTPAEIGKTYEISYDARWITGSPQLHTEIYHKQAARTTILDQPTRVGTPGMPNSVLTNHGPTFADFRHAPVVPTSRQQVTVSANLHDADGITIAEVLYRVDGDSEFTAIAMQSDGQGNYSATLPEQADMTLVQFYLRAQDQHGALSQFPPAGPESRALYRVEDRFNLLDHRHTFQILMMSQDVEALHDALQMMDNHHRPSTIVSDGREAFYDAGTRLRGSMFTRPRLAGTGYNVRFRPDQKFRGVQDSVGFDQAGEREIMAKFLNTQAGNVGGSYEDALELTTPSGVGGGPTLVYLARHTDIYIEEQFGPDGGTVFKLEGIRVLVEASDPNDPESLKLYQPIGWVGSFDIEDLGDDKEIYRWPYLINGNRARDDYSGIIAMAKAFSAPDDQLEEQIQQVLELDSWTTTFALMSILGVGDVYSQGGAHNVNFFVPTSGTGVSVMPWDWDSMLDRPISAPVRGHANVNRVFDVPTFEHHFLGRLRDLMLTVANAEYLDPWIERFNLPFDANFSGVSKYVEDRSRFLRSQLPHQVPFVVGPTGVEVTERALVSPDSLAEYIIPSPDNNLDTVGTQWTELDFVPSEAWQTGAAAVGFDDGSDDFTPFIKTPVPEMKGNNASVYLRMPFQLDEMPDENASFFLRMQYDDGFIAYLNGVPVASQNTPPDPTWNSDADGSNLNNQAITFIRFDLDEHRDLLRSGQNVLAIHGLNSTVNNNDALFAPELVITHVDIQPGDGDVHVTNQPQANLEGIGWIDVREIRLSGSEEPLPVTWNTLNQWSAAVPVDVGEHRLTLEAYDFHGRLIATDTIQVIRRSGADFNNDGLLNISDVDLLCAALRDEDPRSMFDLNEDGAVTQADLDSLIEVHLGTAFGDANLDGRFDSDDLLEVFASGEYDDDVTGNSTWATGDWNCDGEFNSDDLLEAFQRGGYTA